jgi:hypothetical protein
MRKPVSIGKTVESNVWDAHITKATSNKHYATEYKKSNWMLDEFEIAAKKIKRGDPISEGYLRGVQRDKLLEYTDITIQDLEKYLLE